MTSEGVGIQTEDLDLTPVAANDYLKDLDIM